MATIPISLSAPHKPGLSSLGYTIFNLDRSVFANFSTVGVSESGANTGFYFASNVEVPNAGGFLRWSIVAGAGFIFIAEGLILPTQSFTNNEKDKLNELWQRAGLDNANPVTRIKSGDVVTETFGSVSVAITQPSPNTVTSTRQ